MNEHAVLARNLSALADNEFDLLVIGGGIHGLAIAYDAAARGLSVALVERGDFGGAASFNHQKTAHGGLRSLQTGDVRRARESIVERRTLARIAPRLLRPLPFLMGTYRSLVRGRLALRAGFRIDRLLARDRNRRVEQELQLPAPRLVSRAATVRLFPGIRRDGLTGGAMWYDYQIVETDRLTIGVALAAASHGALLANHVEAFAALRDGSRVAGARVRDRLTGTEFDVRARLTVNAAGARAGALMAAFGVERELPLVKAMNLVTNRRAGDLALAAPGADGRMLTMTPWRGTALVGTSQSTEFASPEDETPSAGEVESCLREASAAFPALKLTRDAVTLVHRGTVPAERDRRGRPMLKRRPEIIDHERDGAPGAMTVIGVKYTTARAAAARAVDAAMRKLGRRGHSRTADAVLPGASIADHEALAIETERRLGVSLPEPCRAHIVNVYGARCAEVIALAAEDRGLASPLAPGAAAIAAEVVHAIRNEAARRLDDILMRRTTIGAARCPEDAVIGAAAQIAAAELGWSAPQMQGEIAGLRRRYD